MKTTKILLGALRVSALIVLFAIAMPAQAQVLVNGQFGDGSNSLNGTPSGGLIAPLAYSGTTWNELGVGNTTTALLNSTGGSSGITYSVNDYNWGAAGSYTTDTLQLLKSMTYQYVNALHPLDTALVFSGLSSADTYDIVISGNYDGGDSGDKISIAGYGSQFTTGTQLATFQLDQNYVEFLNVAPTSGSITVDITAPGGVGNAYQANGFQIQAEAPAETPEPSSLATMSLVGMAVLMFCKRLKKQSV